MSFLGLYSQVNLPLGEMWSGILRQTVVHGRPHKLESSI